MAWVDIFRPRFTLRQHQLKGDPFSWLKAAVRADSLAFLANLVTATHLRDVPFSLTSTASRVGVGCEVCFCAFMVWRIRLARHSFLDLCPVLRCPIAVFFLVYSARLAQFANAHQTRRFIVTGRRKKESKCANTCSFC